MRIKRIITGEILTGNDNTDMINAQVMPEHFLPFVIGYYVLHTDEGEKK